MQSTRLNMPQPVFTVDLFCRVIDNFGDAGVCLRLARALVLRHACVVRLWCDDIPLLHRLEPQPPPGLSFHDWQAHARATPGQGVVCGFGCTLDEAYLQAMVAMRTVTASVGTGFAENCAIHSSAVASAHRQAAYTQGQPAYIHLEYLSAEPWVETTHGLWSTHPRLGLKQRFCSPGFNRHTAGVLHEAAALNDEQGLQTLRNLPTMDGLPTSALPLSDTSAQTIQTIQTIQTAKHNVPAAALRVFVFGYLTPAFKAFIAAAQQRSEATHWVLPQGAAGHALFAALHGKAGHTFTRLLFVSQAQFDAALRSCHLAWVRGEDSAVTAMCAGIPMLWQLYPQDDGAQLTKLQAYIHTVSNALANHDLSVWVQAMQACNGSPMAAQEATQLEPSAAQALLQFLCSSLAQPSAAQWAQHCRENVPDLAQTLSLWLRGWKIP
jgi:uncharacterized repeat protein (TIGR03837 family)